MSSAAASAAPARWEICNVDISRRNSCINASMKGMIALASISMRLDDWYMEMEVSLSFQAAMFHIYRKKSDSSFEVVKRDIMGNDIHAFLEENHLPELSECVFHPHLDCNYLYVAPVSGETRESSEIPHEHIIGFMRKMSEFECADGLSESEFKLKVRCNNADIATTVLYNINRIRAYSNIVY